MTVDYLVVGQGICGTFLSYYLQRRGKSVLVIDAPTINNASKIASGVINPVTGRRLVKTWLIDELIPFCVAAYHDIGSELQATLLRQCNVLDFHASPQMQEAFDSRKVADPAYLQQPVEPLELAKLFRFNYGVGEIAPCLLVDLHTLLQQWRRHLAQQGMLLEEAVDWTQCMLDADGVQYKDIRAEKIICCEGAYGHNNPFFGLLPFALNKGEAIIAHIPHLPATNIYKQGISIVPWKEQELFWIGSSYEWNYSDVSPSQGFRKKVEAQLDYWLKLPYTIVDHLAGERPANIERRPFVGLHPVHNRVAILNGMGTKGCSLAPYFAHQLTNFLLDGTPIEPLADVQRFTRVLSR